MRGNVRHEEMKRIVTIGSLLAILIGILTSVHFYSLDGLVGLIFSHVGDTTVYSKSYTDAAFRKVRIGMTESEVLGILGEPLETYTIEHMPKATGMRWSKTPDDSSYAVRVIIFEEGKVKERISEYYID